MLVFFVVGTIPRKYMQIILLEHELGWIHTEHFLKNKSDDLIAVYFMYFRTQVGEAIISSMEEPF